MNLDPEIHFDSANDSRSGFLALDYPTRFICENMEWLSPIHYIETQRYKGTLLEGKIRDVRSVSLIPSIIAGKITIRRNKKGRLISSLSVENPRKDWEYVKDSVVRKALECKFNSSELMKERLAKTQGAKLIDRSQRYDVDIGPILQDIRDGKSGVSAETIMKKERVDYVPLPPAKESEIAEKIMDLSELVAQEERVPKVYPEIVLDGIYNLVAQRDFNAYIPEPTINTKALLSDIKNFEATWNELYHKQPKLLDLIERIHKLYTGRDPEQTNQKVTSGYIALFLLWYSKYASPVERALVDKRLEEELSIILSEEERAYRENRVELVDEPIINTGIPNGMLETGNAGDAAREDRLRVITLPDGRFKVVGRRIGRYSDTLNNLGGVFEKRGQPGFVFDGMDRDSVDKFILSRLGRSEKYKYLFNKFIEDKLVLINDTLEQLSIILGRKIRVKDVKFVVESIYNCDMGSDKALSGIECNSLVTKGMDSDFIEPDAKTKICKWISKIVVEFTSGLSKRSCDLFVERMEIVDNALSVKSTQLCQPEYGYNCYQIAFLRAITNVVLALHRVYDLPITPKLVYQSVYLLLPQQYHIPFKKHCSGRFTRTENTDELAQLITSFVTHHGSLSADRVDRVLDAYDCSLSFAKNILDLTVDPRLVRRIRLISTPDTFAIQITDAENILEEESPGDDLDEIEEQIEDAIDTGALDNLDNYASNAGPNGTNEIDTGSVKTESLDGSVDGDSTFGAEGTTQPKGEFDDLIAEYERKRREGLGAQPHTQMPSASLSQRVPDTIETARSFNGIVSDATRGNLSLPDEIEI